MKPSASAEAIGSEASMMDTSAHRGRKTLGPEGILFDAGQGGWRGGEGVGGGGWMGGSAAKRMKGARKAAWTQWNEEKSGSTVN